jgi:hypothetical protein
MTPNGLRAQHLIPNLSLNSIAYPSTHSFRSSHVTTQSRKISANSFLAERKPTADRELLCRIFLERPSFFRTDFFTKLGPQIRLLPVPNFGVNKRGSTWWGQCKYCLWAWTPSPSGAGSIRWRGCPTLLRARVLLSRLSTPTTGGGLGRRRNFSFLFFSLSLYFSAFVCLCLCNIFSFYLNFSKCVSLFQFVFQFDFIINKDTTLFTPLEKLQNLCHNDIWL